MPTKKRMKRRQEQPVKETVNPQIKVIEENKEFAFHSKKDTSEVKKPEKSVESINEKAPPPHYISERIIGNDQLADIAELFNERFESGYRFKVLIPLRGNESIAIYEKIMTIEFNEASKIPSVLKM